MCFILDRKPDIITLRKYDIYVVSSLGEFGLQPFIRFRGVFETFIGFQLALVQARMVKIVTKKLWWVLRLFLKLRNWNWTLSRINYLPILKVLHFLDGDRNIGLIGLSIIAFHILFRLKLIVLNFNVFIWFLIGPLFYICSYTNVWNFFLFKFSNFIWF
jgi:hypothetical protein